jgi:hypothetical protein
MDLYRIIRELVQERDRLQRIIESLEGMNSAPRSQAPSTGKRRGRKSMDPAARQEVSERMKRYWARRRAARDGNQGNPQQDAQRDDRLDVSQMAAGASSEAALSAGARPSAG